MAHLLLVMTTLDANRPIAMAFSVFQAPRRLRPIGDEALMYLSQEPAGSESCST